MTIREETAEDFSAIGALNGEYEARLIEELRSANQILTSLVAMRDGKVIGQIVFSSLPVEVDGRDVSAAALAPMAVTPEWQRQGVGSQLVLEGLARLRERRVEAVIVLGHVSYYPRFGFSSPLTSHLASPFQGKPAWMALELIPGALSGQKGSVKYPEAFRLKR